MNSQQPIASQEEHRVVKFRPRTAARPLDRAYPSEQRPVGDGRNSQVICPVTNNHGVSLTIFASGCWRTWQRSPLPSP